MTLHNKETRSEKAAHDGYLLKHAEKFRSCDEYRHDQSRQRRFELAFESRDWEESRAAIEGCVWMDCWGGRDALPRVRLVSVAQERDPPGFVK